MSKLTKKILFGLLTLLPVAIVTGYGLLRKHSEAGSGEQGGYKEVYWQRLRDLDYETGRMSSELGALADKKVAIPGFVVPLDDDDQGLAEFLLVPSPKACIHVPPPPPNQMVMVRMKSGKAPKRDGGPVWVKGTLRIETNTSGFGKVSYLLLGDEAEKYQAKE